MDYFYILSYPRSGNHWVRYIIEHFSKLPTLGNDDTPEHIINENDGPIFSRLDCPDFFNTKDYIALKRHNINSDDRRDKGLVFIARNPLECIYRHLELSDVEDFSLSNPKVIKNLDKYYFNWETFTGWNNDKKYLILYEDLIDSEKLFHIIISLLKFTKIEFNTDSVKNFIDNLETHKEKCIGILHAGRGTEGNKTTYYQKLLSAEIKKSWIDYFNSKNSNFLKYFVDYLE